jgi:hypothetical protein
MNFNSFEIQEGKLGKPFRQSGVRRNTDVKPKWIDRVEKWHWIYLFKYIDSEGFFEVEIDYYGKIIKVNKGL